MVNSDTLQSGNSGLLASTGVDFRSGRLVEGLPLVTIGVLSYNYSRYIREALDSLLRQSYPNIELIIVDDCSAEEATRSIIRHWISNNNIHCTYIENDTNLGITAVSNMIVRRASGKYINLFATDDIMLPEKIERQVELLEAAGEEYGLCYANPRYMDEDGMPLGDDEQFRIFEGDVLLPYIKRDFYFTTPTSFIRRSVYDKVGYYDERVLIEDYNFFLRLVACFKVKYCDYPCLVYRVKRNGTPIFEQWNKNNQERYFRDRILSNFHALPFIDNQPSRRLVKAKITQYLKSLAVNRSGYFWEMIVYLVRHRYTPIPWKAVLIRLYVAVKPVK